MKKGAFLLLAAWFVAFPGAAQTWTGGGANNNWSTGANWSGGVAPASSSATQLTFSTSPRFAPVVDAPWTVNQLSFPFSNYSLSGQTLTFDGANAQIVSGGATVTIANPIVLAAPVAINGVGFAFTLAGPISGPGSLTIGAGNGGTILASNSTFTGGVIVVGGGAFALAGSIPGPVTVASFGHFSGSGSVAGAVTVSADGGIRLGGTPLSTGPLVLGAGSFTDVAINGTRPGQFGSVSVAGAVALAGSTLTLTDWYVPIPGDVFTIIVNDGADPVVGTFKGLPEGATITFNGVPLQISYVGGTGNDVTLTALGPLDTHPVPTLSEWALIILATLVLGVGMLKTRRR